MPKRTPSDRWNVALITGASSGIGERFAYALAERGSDLVLVARSGARLEEIADELRDAHGIDVEVIAADLTDRGQLADVEHRLTDVEPPVDLLVNNAGFGTYGPFHELDPDTETAELDLNVTALTRLCHAALPRMVARGAGAVLNVSSAAAFQPVPYNATYAASKSYVLTLSEALHEELAELGVTVTALCPGYVRTGFQERAEVRADHLPSVVWSEVDDVVETALSDIARGVAVSVPGIGYRVLGSMSRMTPTWLSRKVAGAITKQM